MSQMLEMEKGRDEAKHELAEKEEFINKIALLSPNIIYVIDIEKWTNIFHNRRDMENTRGIRRMKRSPARKMRWPVSSMTRISCPSGGITTMLRYHVKDTEVMDKGVQG